MSSNELYQARYGISIPGQERPSYRASFSMDNASRADDFTQTEDLKQRSMLAAEFGIENKGRSLSCFLNVVLQALWSLPIVRANLVAFCDLRDGGPLPLKLLINAIQDFYKQVSEQPIRDQVLVYDSTSIRRELFKLRYFSGTFELNREADASEALDYLLTCMHTWSQIQGRASDAELALTIADYNLAQSALAPCTLQDSCFIHTMFHIQHQICRQCTCGQAT